MGRQPQPPSAALRSRPAAGGWAVRNRADPSRQSPTAPGPPAALASERGAAGNGHTARPGRAGPLDRRSHCASQSESRQQRRCSTTELEPRQRRRARHRTSPGDAGCHAASLLVHPAAPSALLRAGRRLDLHAGAAQRSQPAQPLQTLAYGQSIQADGKRSAMEPSWHCCATPVEISVAATVPT